MGILDLIFPKSCLSCGKSGGYICLSCINKVKTPRPICPICLKPSLRGMTHPVCRGPLNLDGLVSLWNYDGVVRKAILTLKYKFALEISKELSNYAIHRIGETKLKFSKDDILVPIPLYWYKKNFRGFNQGEEIGGQIAQLLGLRFVPDLLIKKTSTIPQTGLRRSDRLRNVENVFILNPSHSSFMSRNCFILFDDVWTTGTTLKEATKIFKKAGALEVRGLTLARGVS